ncbi:ABC transporter substrate-binding protein [Paenibacillus hexagrammi]|uniref:ABC transporter substrate-binding protein n=1 Tax=Paenibacillus hexagrammi TaxID=2908839 RepID=A0ABY3SCD7_9BACL|nr:ABC transporter substrate-binding protein [Paenibacillus sp. YPD9-1]UJF31669.1 ABC transporter substrate-binding protein [Paenibacillus sp. YPD9-1]
MISEHEDPGLPPGLEEKDAEWNSIDRLVLGCSLLTFNMNKEGPQQHILFRKAIDLLLDREGMIKELGGSRVLPAKGFLPDTHMIVSNPEYHLVEAKRLLSEMGYKGEQLCIYIYPQHEQDALWIRNQCALAGIQVNVLVCSEQEMVDLPHIKKADMILYQVIMESGYELHLIEALEQRNSYVRVHMDDSMIEAVEQRVADLLAEPDQETRIRQMDAIYVDLQKEKTFLFVLHRFFRTSYHSSIRGIKISDLGWVDFRRVWFAQASSDK